MPGMAMGPGMSVMFPGHPMFPMGIPRFRWSPTAPVVQTTTNTTTRPMIQFTMPIIYP